MTRSLTTSMLPLLVLASLLAACDEGSSDERPAAEGAEGAESAIDTEGEAVDPPFEVKGDCEGLLLVWFDSEGVHTAEARSEIPEDRRRRVRVDSLELPPEERLAPEWVYVADLRHDGVAAGDPISKKAGDDGQYPVRKVRRAAFDALVDAAVSDGQPSGGAVAKGPQPSHQQQPVQGAAGGDADVVIYGASWCGACDEAASFLRDRGVPFVEKDIEKNPSALAEMQRKANKAGVSPSSIPIIDFRGTVMRGFDPNRLSQLIDESAQPI